MWRRWWWRRWRWRGWWTRRCGRRSVRWRRCGWIEAEHKCQVANIGVRRASAWPIDEKHSEHQQDGHAEELLRENSRSMYFIHWYRFWLVLQVDLLHARSSPPWRRCNEAFVFKIQAELSFVDSRRLRALLLARGLLPGLHHQPRTTSGCPIATTCFHISLFRQIACVLSIGSNFKDRLLRRTQDAST